MANTDGEYDVIVIGTGSAASETAREAARQGKSVLSLTLHPGAIASVMCSSPYHHGSSRGYSVEELKGEIIEPDVETLGIRTQSIQAESQHSVFILQAPVQVPSFTNSTESVFHPSYQEDEEPVKGIAANKVLREREMHARKKMTQRPTVSPGQHKPESSDVPDRDMGIRIPPDESDPAQKPVQPTFREREMNLRKKLSRGFRNPQQKPAAPVHQEPIESEPAMYPDAFHSRKEPMPSKRPFEEHIFSGTETIHSEPAVKSYSNSVIPMDQTRFRNRRSVRKKEPRPFSKKWETPNTGSVPHPPSRPIPGPKVWEEKDRDETPLRETRSPLPPTHRSRSLPARNERQRSLSTPEWDSRSAPRKELPALYEPDLGYGEEDLEYRPFTRRSPRKSVTSEPERKAGSRPLHTEQAAPSSRQKPFSGPPAPQWNPSSGSKEWFREGFALLEKEAARNVLEKSSSTDSLKRDTIDIEDPYGSSYEDLLPPFASNNGQGNTELEQLEKRKLALRGLHNLINNLG